MKKTINRYKKGIIIDPKLIEEFNKILKGCEEILKDTKGIIKSDGFYIHVSNFKSTIPVYIYNTSGALVKSINTNKEGVCLVPISTLPSGVYIIKVSNISKKIIIK